MIMALNTQLLLLAHTYAVSSPLIMRIVIVLARHADIVVIIGVVLFLLIHRHRPNAVDSALVLFWREVKEIALVFTTAVLAWMVAVFLKMNIMFPRPFMTLPIEPLFYYGGIDSFPSGHATFFMALAVAVWFHHRYAGYTLLVAALAIGITRVMAGIHYPLDVLVGWGIGALLAVGVYRLWKRLRAWYLGNRT